jgi:signal transduction histidine kinase
MATGKPLPKPDTAQRNYPALVRRYAHLLEITRRLTSTKNMEDIHIQVAEGTVTLLECEAAVLFLQDIPSGSLYIATAAGVDPASLRGRVLPRSNSLAAKTLLTNNPILIDRSSGELNESLFEATGMAPLQPKAILAVPLRSKGNTAGVLEAINKLEGSFHPEDFSSLEALASQAAVSMENLRLFHQSDLIAELVHEIRTPLAALSTASSLLDRPDLNDSQRHSVLSTFRREIQRLSELTDDYLDLARLESGRVRMQMELFSVAALVSECVEIASPLVHAQGLRLRQDLPRDSLEIEADRTKIKQVILNLLSNAVKYNVPLGEIILRAFRGPCIGIGDTTSVCIQVADTGKGIPPEDLPHVFKRFFRSQDGDSLTRGTGLGLYIARHIVESHHGRIEVESRPGQGTTFTITLPGPLATRPAESPQNNDEKHPA